MIKVSQSQQLNVMRNRKDTILVFSSTCAIRLPELEDGNDSSGWTELGSPKLMFGANVEHEGAACPGMLESMLTRVAIFLSTIADTGSNLIHSDRGLLFVAWFFACFTGLGRLVDLWT